MRPVAITGCGAVTPLGVGAGQLFARWTAGDSGIEDGVGRCADFLPTDFMSSKQARRTERFAQLAVAAATEAVLAAGWDPDDPPYDPERVACIVGTGIGGLGAIETQLGVLRDRGSSWVSPLTVPLMMAHAAAASVAIRFGLRGESYGLVSACAAGTQAIGAAVRALQSGDLDAVVTGGAESALSPLAHAAFDRMGALSKTGISRPFDARRDGFVMAEGAGVLVLETPEAVRRRGGRARARVTGYAATSDAAHITAPDADGVGACQAMERALASAGRTAADVGYVNLHGTSTPLNDRAETVALKRLLGARAGQVPMSAPKSAIGHLLGAAGAVEAVATVATVEARLAPPTLNYEEVEDGLDLDYVGGSARALAADAPPVALSNSFGFGGHNAVLALEAV